MKSTTISAIALSLFGCGDPIHPQQVIEKPRVLGARVEVVGDVERATPAPSETAGVRWLVVDPLGVPDVGWSLVACEPEPVATGVGRCRAHPLTSDVSGMGTHRLPALEFTVPQDYQASTVLVAGIVCFGGTPPDTTPLLRDWPRVTRCGAGRGQAVTFEVTVDHGGANNLNPSLRGDPLKLESSSWLSLEGAVDEPCVDQEERVDLPRASAGGRTVSISYAPDEADREKLSDGSGESLLMASFSDAGELERTFSVVEWGTTGLKESIELGWSPPTQAPPGGKVVHFYFVLRDSRGGSDWTERALCLVR